MDKQLRQSLLDAKEVFETEGFIILGVFGSRARGDFGPESDVDILYSLNAAFRHAYPGWETTGRLLDIREELSLSLGRTVDLADIDALGKVSQKYILSEATFFS